MARSRVFPELVPALVLDTSIGLGRQDLLHALLGIDGNRAELEVAEPTPVRTHPSAGVEATPGTVEREANLHTGPG